MFLTHQRLWILNYHNLIMIPFHLWYFSFYDATKEVLIALELIKSNPANRLLNWPGIHYQACCVWNIDDFELLVWSSKLEIISFFKIPLWEPSDIYLRINGSHDFWAFMQDLLIFLEGSKTTIPESDDNHLSHKLQQLLQQCRSRPRPDALCLFEECLTHYQKKEIYQSDIHFEVRIQCCNAW